MMSNDVFRKMIPRIAFLAILGVLVLSPAAMAEPQVNEIMNLVQQSAKDWEPAIMDAAMFIFYTLGTISLVFTYGFMLMRKADVQEFFAETLRFMLFFGFFLWLLQNGPTFAQSIIDSLHQLATKAGGSSLETKPSWMIDVGFMLLEKTLSHWDNLSPFVSIAGFLVALLALICISLIAINIFIVMASGWILVYAGFFFLGFGGSRWTSDIAINYYKTVLALAAKLMVLFLIVGMFVRSLDKFYAAQAAVSIIDLNLLSSFLVFCLLSLFLSWKLPDMVAGIVGGASVASVGSTSAGTMAGAVTSAAAAITGAAAGLAGAASAIKAAANGKGGDSKGGAGKTVAEAFAKAGASGGGESAESTPNVEQPPPPAASGGGESGGGGDSSSGGSDASSGGGGGDASSSGGDSSGDSSSDSSGDSSGDSSSQSASSSAGGGDASSGGDSPNTDVGGQSDSGGDKSASSNSGDGKKGNRVLQALSKIDSGINKAATTAAAVGGTVAAAGSAVTSKAGEVASKAGKAIADPVKKAASATAKAMPTTTAALGATARGAGRVGRTAGNLAKGAGQVAAARFQDRVDQSVGGQIAAQIKASHGNGNGNAIGTDLAAEVQDFVDRKPSSSK